MTAPAASASPPAPAETADGEAPEDGPADSPPRGPDLPERSARAVAVATWVVVAIGTGLRVRQWAHGRAFWLDELLLQRAMSQQRMSELLAPLGFSQSAPPGWLAVQHAVLGASGSDERAARALPLLCGVGTLVLTVLLARTVLSGPAALLATAVVALSPPLIGYSVEFKQYSSDVLCVLLVVLLGTRVALRRGRPDRARLALAGAGGAVVWFSHAGALVTAGVLAALALVAVVRRDGGELRAAVACAVPAATGLAVEYAVLLRRNAADGILRDYWASAFPPEPLTWPAAVSWAGGRLTAVRESVLALEHPVLLVVLLLAGLVALGLRRPRALVLLLVPTAVVAAAGLAGAYPIDGRLALFFVPLVALALAAPLDLPRLAARLPRPAARRPATAAAAMAAAAVTLGVAVLVESQVSNDWHDIRHPHDKQESRTVLAALTDRRGPRDLLLVDGRGARYAAAFYAPRVGAGPFEVLQPADRGCPASALGARLWAGRRYDRVWLLAVHTRPVELAFYRAQLAGFGPVAEVIRAPGAAVLRFDRSATPPAEDRAAAGRAAAGRCLAVLDPATLP